MNLRTLSQAGAHGIFSDFPDAAAFAEVGPHSAARLKMQFVIDRAMPLGVLIGDPGCGKTILLMRLQADSAKAERPSELFRLPPDCPIRLSDTLGGLAREAQAANGTQAVALIDDADQLRPETVQRGILGPLREHRHLTVILAGSRHLLSRLRVQPELEQRVSVACALTALTAEETASYVRCRLSAGGAPTSLFDDSACQSLAELSGGVPRLVNRLADLALFVAAADGRESICGQSIEQVASELLSLRAAA